MFDFLVFIVFWLAFVAWFLAKPSPYSRLALGIPLVAVLVLYGFLGQPFVPASLSCLFTRRSAATVADARRPFAAH